MIILNLALGVVLPTLCIFLSNATATWIGSLACPHILRTVTSHPLTPLRPYVVDVLVASIAACMASTQRHRQMVNLCLLVMEGC